MGCRVIIGPWGQPRDGEAMGLDYRTYEQCCVQQEHAFAVGKYYEVFVVNHDGKKCFVKPCTREQALAQMSARGVEVEP